MSRKGGEPSAKSIGAAFAERIRAARQAEARLTIVGRKVEPLADLIDKKLKALCPLRVADVHGSAALQFRLLRHRRRQSGQALICGLNQGENYASDRQQLAGECVGSVRHHQPPLEERQSADPEKAKAIAAKIAAHRLSGASE